MKKIVFDENFAQSIANGFAGFQKGRPAEGVEVHHVIPLFGQGAPDEDWIPALAGMSGVAITHVVGIQKTQALWELVQLHELGIFFLRPPKGMNYKYWRQVQEILKHWAHIKEIALNEKPPFGYEMKPRSSKPERLSL